MTSTRRQLLQALRPYWPHLAGGALCVAAVVGTQLILPLAFGFVVVDELLVGKGDVRLLSLMAVGGVGLMVLKGLFHYARTYLTAFAGHRLVMDLRNRIFDHLQRLSLGFHERQRAGDLMSRVTTDIAMIQNSVTTGIGDWLNDVLLLAGILILLFGLHWQLALLTLLTLPLIALAIARYGSHIRRYTGQMQDRVADLSAILQETLGAIRVVKAFAMEEEGRRRFARQNERGFRAGMKSVQMMATVYPVVEILVAAGLALVLWFGGREVLAGRLTPGAFTAFLAYLGMAGAPVSSLTRTLSQFQQALAAADRIFHLLSEGYEVQDRPGAHPLVRARGRVRFAGVSFRYGEDKPWALRDVDLTVEPGEVVALVGPNGAGKSTLVNLLPRFYDPTEGSVEFDGHDLRELTIASLRRQIGLVPQEVVLFGGSVAENIACGRPGASPDEIRRAAELANAHAFIEDLPQGYDTPLGERGVGLSGGQRQRIAIARAVLRDPRVLILDEATSALDAESAALVQAALERLMEDRTTFVIAHSMAAIDRADRIVVIDGGRIVEVGSPRELLRAGGVYGRLHRIQQRAVGDDRLGPAWEGERAAWQP